MISIKTQEEINTIARGAKILSATTKELIEMVKPGITTEELDRAAKALIFKYGGRCAFLGYQGFPACLCSSVNEEIVHSVPSKRVLKNGDIITLDLGVLFEDFNTDMAVTVPVGKIDNKTKDLVMATKKALEIGIDQVKIGNTFGDIGYAVQKYIEKQGFSIVKSFCGHGIGKELHEDPLILNYLPLRMQEREQWSNIKIKEGMVFCIEPIIAFGKGEAKKAKDGFGFETKDGSLSAHFEHTIAVIKNETRILTDLS